MLALAMKLCMPAGFMPMIADGAITIQLCPDAGAMIASIPGVTERSSETPASKSNTTGKDMPCPFAGLLAPVVSGADAILLAALIAAIVASGVWTRTAPSERVARYLRPPLRAPPARA